MFKKLSFPICIVTEICSLINGFMYFPNRDLVEQEIWNYKSWVGEFF